MPRGFAQRRNDRSRIAWAIVAAAALVGCEELGPRRESSSPANRNSGGDTAREPNSRTTEANNGVAPLETKQRGLLEFPALSGTPDAQQATYGKNAGTDRSVVAALSIVDGASSKTGTGDSNTAVLQSPEELQSALRVAEEHNRRGLALAARGALFSARAEFTAALRASVAACDASAVNNHTSGERAVALIAAATALTEAEDFVPRRAQLAGEIDVATVLRSHHCGAIVESAAGLSAAAAHDNYLAFAVQQFALAACDSQPASVALHGLGKVAAAAAAQNPAPILDARSKARVYFAAALAIDAANFPAANDLAVLLAEEGRFEQARDLLNGALQVSPQPALWNNLATVYERMGSASAAQSARLQARAAAQTGATGAGLVVPAHHVEWLDSRAFAAATIPSTELQRQAAPRAPATVSAVPRRAVMSPPPSAANGPPAARSIRHILGN